MATNLLASEAFAAEGGIFEFDCHIEWRKSKSANPCKDVPVPCLIRRTLARSAHVDADEQRRQVPLILDIINLKAVKTAYPFCDQGIPKSLKIPGVNSHDRLMAKLEV